MSTGSAEEHSVWSLWQSADYNSIAAGHSHHEASPNVWQSQVNISNRRFYRPLELHLLFEHHSRKILVVALSIVVVVHSHLKIVPSGKWFVWCWNSCSLPSCNNLQLFINMSTGSTNTRAGKLWGLQTVMWWFHNIIVHWNNDHPCFCFCNHFIW